MIPAPTVQGLTGRARLFPLCRLRRPCEYKKSRNHFLLPSSSLPLFGARLNKHYYHHRHCHYLYPRLSAKAAIITAARATSRPPRPSLRGAHDIKPSANGSSLAARVQPRRGSSFPPSCPTPLPCSYRRRSCVMHPCTKASSSSSSSPVLSFFFSPVLSSPFFPPFPAACPHTRDAGQYISRQLRPSGHLDDQDALNKH